MNKSLILCTLRCFLWLVGILLLTDTAAHAASVKAGDILVIDQIGGTNSSGALFFVNPVSGKRSILSDFGDPTEGPVGSGDLVGVASMKSGPVYVSALFSGTGGNGAIFQVDPKTGNRTIAVDFGQGTLQGFPYYGLAENASGTLLANLSGPAPPFPSFVIRVDPTTGHRVLVSDFTNPTQGETGLLITDLAFGHLPTRTILIATEIANCHAAVFRVNPDTGDRTLVSDFTNPAQGTDMADLFAATGLADTDGQILVNSSSGLCGARDLLLSINPHTGDRRVLSDFDNPAQGIQGSFLRGLGLDKSGQLIIAAGPLNDLFANKLFRINPRTGSRAVFSDSSNSGQGPPFIGIVDLTVAP